MADEEKIDDVVERIRSKHLGKGSSGKKKSSRSHLTEKGKKRGLVSRVLGGIGNFIVDHPKTLGISALGLGS